ncbi:MAG: hypothetical protein PHG08_03710 [Bacilli bacterium]|jgi:hypothetical protein|nr:hypothetical protein [Bacilli bacterium]HHU24188.1 hypothetical protein [Acholeplasmataceae bacterium]
MSKSKKTVNEKKPFLAILPVAIGLVLIFGITLGIWAFSGPKANPQISNPNDPFLRLGDYVITNEKLYYALRQSYSYDEIQRFIDTELLKDINVDKNSDDYQEFRNEIIYGVKKLEDLDSDKTPAEILEVFENNMTISGYFTEAEREAYIELQYRREKYARQKYDEEIEEKKKDGRPFDISKYQTYYDQNYLTSVKAITILFDTEQHAKSVLELFGIDIEKLSSSGWISKDTGEAMTEKEVKQTFIDMYNYMYRYYNNGAEPLLKNGSHYEVESETVDEETIENINFLDLSSDNINKYSKFIFTAKELDDLNSQFKSTIIDSLKLEDSFYKSYTNSPVKLATSKTEQKNASGYFLALKIEETLAQKYVFDFDDDTDEEKIPSDELFAEIEEKLIEENFTPDVVSEKMFKLRREHELVIYDSIIEALYKNAYDNFFKNTLKLEADKYPEFKPTKEKSKDTILSFTLNGQKVTYKVADFFKNLSNRYGVNASFSFMNTHLFLANKEYNEIYNPVTKEVYDKARLKEIIEQDVKMYSYYFSMNYFETQGFPQSYGWKRFLKEFFQVEDENELAVQINVLSDAQTKFAKTFYTYDLTETNNVAMNTLKARMEKIRDEYFSGSVFNLIAYVDYNADGLVDINDKDEESDWTNEQKTLAQLLLEKIFEDTLTSTGTTLYEQVNEIANKYKDSVYPKEDKDPSEMTIYERAKKAGLHVKLESAQTYTNSSGIVDEFKAEMKALYDIAREAGKIDGPLRSDPFTTMYGYHKIALVSYTDYAYKNAEKTETIPTEEEIELYEESLLQDANTPEEEKITISDELKAALTFYYEPVKQYFTSEDRVSLGLIDYRGEKVASGEISYADANFKTKFEAINAALRKSALETLEEGE